MKNIGTKKFYKNLKNKNDSCVYNINPNDKNRLIRSWEIHKITNKSIYELRKKNKKRKINNLNFFKILILPPKQKVYLNCNQRWKAMLQLGAINEVKKLLSLNLDPSLPIMKAHGVPEISQYLSGTISLEECISKTQKAIRNYVKRQITWWKSSKFYNSTIFEHFPTNIDLKSLDFLKKIN